MDAYALQHSWDQVTKHGEQVPLYFYSHLFVSYPEVRSMFPLSMSNQRDKFVGALGRIVSHADQIEKDAAFLQHLGRDHRKYAVVAEHYNAVGASLCATLMHFLGSEWDEELAADWTAAYQVVARIMVEAAETSSESSLTGGTPTWSLPSGGPWTSPFSRSAPGARSSSSPASRCLWRSRNAPGSGGTSARPTPRVRTAPSICMCNRSTVAR
jgi:hemoglobin-like flavoprotein